MSHHQFLTVVFVSAIFGFAFLPVMSMSGEEKKSPKQIEIDVGGGVKMKLVYIKPGKFMMGSPEAEIERFPNELLHEVEISQGFYIGIFEVTQEEFEKVTGKNPSTFKGDPRLPVNTVTWNEAMDFCQRLSKQTGKSFDLPTEAEWEYACRGGTKGPFHYGDSLSSKQANFHGDYPYGGADKGPKLQKPARVGSYTPNSFGLFDMHGNVLEWCKDWFEADYYKASPPKDPPGPQAGKLRTLRGGSWSYDGRMCRSAMRSWAFPDNPGKASAGSHGLRVVLRQP